MGFIAAYQKRNCLRRQAVINVLYLLCRPASAWDIAPYVGREVWQVIREVQSLEDQKFLASQWNEPRRPDGKPRRRYYTLTEKGRQARTVSVSGPRGSSCSTR